MSDQDFLLILSGGRTEINVGGRLFETTISTLRSGGSDSLLYSLSLRLDPVNPIFIDRDPDIFSVLLSLLRSGRLPSGALHRFSRHELLDEAIYYGIEHCLRSATCPPPLRAYDASLSAVLRPASDPFPSAFCAAASDDGSLLFAHGGQVSAFDWNLSPAGTVRTHADHISSLRRVWSDTAAIGSASAPGLHFYDVSVGRHVGSVHWSDPSDPRVYKACVAAITDSADSVFSSFECPHRENSVLAVDKETLKVTAEIGRQSGSSAKGMTPEKLSYLPEHGLLFGCAISCGAFGFSGYLRLWDIRSGSVVWETNEPGSGRSSRFGDPFADVDADAEESAIFKVCSKSGDLAVADLRKLGEDPWVYLEEKDPNLRCAGGDTGILMHCYRKQVFVSKRGGLEAWSQVAEEGIEVQSACEKIYRRNLVDKEEDSKRGVIRMMEGGGNRLFISREGVEGVEVWESSTSSGAISAD